MWSRILILAMLLAIILGALGMLISGYYIANGQEPARKVACAVKWVHDGDTFRCEGYAKSTRLYGVDAPEMPGACREGRSCVSGDPYASKTQLERLIGGRALQCTLMDTDRYGRPVMRCSSGGKDLSCAMVRSGQAVERYGRLGC